MTQPYDSPTPVPQAASGPYDEPYGQPPPFDPTTHAQPARRTPPPRSRRLLVPAVLGVALALGGFAGGYALANARGTRASGGTGSDAFGTGRFPNGELPNASFRARGGFGGGAGGFGGGAAGTIGSVSSDQMTIDTQAGGSRIVLLTPTTRVSEISSTTKALGDLSSGQQVTVIGTANPDGSVTATRVIIGEADVLGGLGRGIRPGASQAP